jgi:hypothetical protein
MPPAEPWLNGYMSLLGDFSLLVQRTQRKIYCKITSNKHKLKTRI